MTTLLSPPVPPPSGPADDSATVPRRRSRRPRLWLVMAALVLLMVVPVTSYAQALAAPGGGGWQVQSVEWIRDHGGAPLVNTIENWWYGRQAPSTGNPPRSSVPLAGGALPPAAGAPSPLAPLAGARPLAGEGRWVPGRLDPAGTPAMYTSFVRPDPSHRSVLAGVAWIRAGATAAHLVAGLRQPEPGWAGAGQVPSADVPSLVATFNSGWKFRDIDGGFYLDGRTASPLRNGEASVVIDDQGRVSVGQWGRDVGMSPQVRAVRQNMALVVDRGAPVPGLATNGSEQWGSRHNQLQYTWRSGLGTDAAGNLIYVAGNGLTLRTLADAMAQAGIQRGMELDIHTRMVAFSSWQPGRAGPVTPSKLLPDIASPADRYLGPDQRDFFYVTLR